MGHYDSSQGRAGYCGKCGAGPGNMRVDGSCPFCVTERNVGTPANRKLSLAEKWARGQKMTTEVDLAEAELRALHALANPAFPSPAVLIANDGAVWGRVSDEQVLVLLEQAVAEVKRRNGWQS